METLAAATGAGGFEFRRGDLCMELLPASLLAVPHHSRIWDCRAGSHGRLAVPAQKGSAFHCRRFNDTFYAGGTVLLAPDSGSLYVCENITMPYAGPELASKPFKCETEQKLWAAFSPETEKTRPCF
jgi:hypothetical protein